MKITQITMQDRGGLLYKIQVDYYAIQRWNTMQDRGGLLCKIEVDYYARKRWITMQDSLVKGHGDNVDL